MTRLQKLIEKTQRNPNGLSFSEFEWLLTRFGFVLQRTRGSHRAYAHPDCPRLMVVQPRGKEAQGYQVREFLDMVEQYGLGTDVR